MFVLGIWNTEKMTMFMLPVMTELVPLSSVDCNWIQTFVFVLPAETWQFFFILLSLRRKKILGEKGGAHTHHGDKGSGKVHWSCDVEVPTKASLILNGLSLRQEHFYILIQIVTKDLVNQILTIWLMCFSELKFWYNFLKEFRTVSLKSSKR